MLPLLLSANLPDEGMCPPCLQCKAARRVAQVLPVRCGLRVLAAHAWQQHLSSEDHASGCCALAALCTRHMLGASRTSPAQSAPSLTLAASSCPPPGAASAPTVLLVSLKAGGVGLNLTAASRVHMLDPWCGTHDGPGRLLAAQGRWAGGRAVQGSRGGCGSHLTVCMHAVLLAWMETSPS